ncbi:unnamed protein product [Darwinula stevensoni]|uniref:FIP-RBD domain-containing protein n=1 Tax=Darwinula stevensoni TaxID=69355 RepID=A0A7R8XFA8_9CRUS|nr:unnamed protein product [Darwinula stevensoni]CAG0895090.1 unnamed protein product [Darwinula stevensoni]
MFAGQANNDALAQPGLHEYQTEEEEPLSLIDDNNIPSGLPEPQKPVVLHHLPGMTSSNPIPNGHSFEIDYGGEQKFESDGGNTSSKEGEDEEEGEENDLHGSPDAFRSFPNRNSWLRTSLRRTPPRSALDSPHRRCGSLRVPNKPRLSSSALASALYRSSSFTSSGRGSGGDAEEHCSDVSLEEDVLDLNHKVQQLQDQVNALAESQTNTDDRYQRVKQENSSLTTRVHMLEEQLREVELRCEERLAEEQQRGRDLMARLDRERQLQLENYQIRYWSATLPGTHDNLTFCGTKSSTIQLIQLNLCGVEVQCPKLHGSHSLSATTSGLQSLERDHTLAQEEASRLRSQVERLKSEKGSVEDQLSESEHALSVLKEEHRKLQEACWQQQADFRQERSASNQLLEEMSKELNGLRHGTCTPACHRHPLLQDLQDEVQKLRDENERLRETNEELQATLLTKGLEEGRRLLSQSGLETSLASEFQEMTNDEVNHVYEALKDQQEVNSRLRAYIDGILLNIVENHPQLLEVKNKK